MTRGGKRPGAGAKPTRPPVKRRLMLELSPAEAVQLCVLEARLQAPASVILRNALGLLYAMDEAELPPRKRCLG